MKNFCLSVGLLFVFMVYGCGSEDASKKPTHSGNSSDSLAISIDTSTIEGKIQRITRLLEYSPDNFTYYHRRSLLYYEAGNMVQAFSDVQRCIQLNPKWPKGYHLRGFFYKVQENDSLAFSDFKRAADLGSSNPETFYSIGQLHFLKKEYSLADDAYDAAIELDSAEPTYYFAKGLNYRLQKNPQKAIDYYNESLKLNPAFIKSLSELHNLYLNDLRNPEIARRYNQRILVFDSLHPLGNFNEAMFFLRSAEKLTNEADSKKFNSLLANAVLKFGTSLSSDPQFVQSYYFRGYSFFLGGQYEPAVVDFDRTIALDPFHARAFFMKGSIHESLEQEKSALESFNRALEIEPDWVEAQLAVKQLSEKLNIK